MKDNETPEMPLSMVYADTKRQIFRAVQAAAQKSRLPVCMIEGILEAILSEYRQEEALQLAAEAAQYKAKLKDYLDGQGKEVEPDGR